MSAGLVTLALAIAMTTQDPLPAQPGAVAYAGEQFEAAFATYEQLLAEPTAARGPLFYNLGNCAYRLGRHAEAVVWYRRAARHLPRDGEVRFNLTLAEQHLGVDNAPTSPTAMAWAVADAYTPGELLALTAALQSLGLALILLRRRSSAARPLGVALVTLGLLAATPMGIEVVVGRTPAGVVLAPTAEVRGMPDAAAAVTTRLGAGELVAVTAQTDQWVCVAHTRGRGWVPRAEVGLVQE